VALLRSDQLKARGGIPVPRVDYDIVIVGAGIAGSALACALQQQDWRIALVEANPLQLEMPAFETGVENFDSRVSALTPASIDLLEGLQAWDAVRACRSLDYRHMHVWDAEGTGFIDFDAADLGVAALGTIVENRLLTASLNQCVVSAGQVDVYNPARVEELELREEGGPVLHLADGSSISCSLLVGADGALSKLRELAGFQTREWDYGHSALVCTAETRLPHNHTAYQRFLDTGPLAFLPLPEQSGSNFCSIVWSAEPDLSEALQAMPDKEFRLALERALESRLGDIVAVSRRIGFPLRQRHAVDYVQPGIALVGDAAHTIHPLAGQGINLGLLDVAVLAEELAAAGQRQETPGDLAVLRRYQRRRKGENLLMMAAMDGFKLLFSRRELPVRWLRNTGMRLVGQALPVKRQIMRHAMGIR
jgi:2-octaprenylphenol hydroxylase